MTDRRSLLAQWLSSWHHTRTVGRALPPRCSSRRKISASAAAGRTIRRVFGPLDADDGRWAEGGGGGGGGGGGEDLLTFVRVRPPSAHRRSPSSLLRFLLSQSATARPPLPSLIAPVIRSRIPEQASEPGTFWPLCSPPRDGTGILIARYSDNTLGPLLLFHPWR